MQLQFDTNVKILEHTKESLEDYISKFNEERKKNIESQNKIHMLEINLAELPKYVRQIEDFKLTENNLENKIKDLCESPFIKQAEERGNVYRKLQETDLALSEAKRRLKVLEESNVNLEKENKLLIENNNVEKADKDKYKEEAMRYKISNEEREKNTKHFTEQFNLLGQYGEVDSNFTKILNILKMKDDSNSWMKIDFLDKMSEAEIKDPVFLAKEIERLKIEKGLLGSELQKTKSLLQIQQQINEDQQKVYDEDKKISKYQVDKLMKKCEELSKLVDIERLPKDLLRSPLLNNQTSSNLQLLLNDTRKDLLLNNLLPQEANMMSDSLTEFSKDETDTDFGINENALDIYVGEAIFEEGLERQLGFKLVNMMSFCSVDFYLHETQISNLTTGNKPIYSLQISFKMNVDEHIIHYLESDYVSIDIFYIKDNIQALLGKGKIPLQQLIAQESSENLNIYDKFNQNSRVVNNVCSIYYAKDTSLLVGTIHYKMRMRNPLLETVKWYKERNQLIRDISPVHDVTMKKVEKELLTLDKFSKGKVMAVTILITKAINIKVSGSPRKIMPYIYYQFYKFDEHFTKTTFGNDPLFQDVEKFDVVYDSNFHDYVNKESIQFIILDDSRALEVQMQQDENKTNSVNLVENGEYDDLIGIATVPIKDLLVHDKIQNNFPIINKVGKNAGELVLSIFWEQVTVNNESQENKLPYETKIWEESLISKLANLLKHKHCTISSAFALFDQDNKNSISILNFKNTIWFTLKFSQEQQEIEQLTNLIFGTKTEISQLDFYKIFAYHLPNEGPAGNLINSNLNETSTVNYLKKTLDNQIVQNNISLNISPNKSLLNESNLNNNLHNTSYLNNNSQQVINLISNNENKDKRNISPKTSLKGNSPRHSLTKKETISKTTNIEMLPSSNRPLTEIVAKMNEFMIKSNRRTVVELFKLFDRSGNTFVEKNVK